LGKNTVKWEAAEHETHVHFWQPDFGYYASRLKGSSPIANITTTAVQLIVSAYDATYTAFNVNAFNDVRIEKCCIPVGDGAQTAGRIVVPLYLGSSGRNTVGGIVPLDSNRKISYKLTPQSNGPITMTLVYLGHFEPANYP
jgi:hypothetical protein